MKELVDQISARLRDQKIEVPDEEIASRLKKLIDDFRVPEGEARRSVLNYFLKEHGVVPIVRASSEKVKISDIKEAGKWVDLEIKVLDLWEPATEAISQTGLIGDGSGSMKFVKWAKSELPNLELGQSYLLKKVVTDEFQGRFSVKLNRTSQIEPLEIEVEAGPASKAAQEMKVAEISEPGLWVDLLVKVVQLWEENSDSISQSGLIGDETGTIKFVKWAKADLPDLVEGKSYHLRNLVTDEFQGRFSVKLNRTSQIELLEKEVEARPVSKAAQEMKVVEISEPGLWVDLLVRVAQLWEVNSDSISQSGLIGDETGTIKFVKWVKADLPDLVEGKSYHLRNLVTDEFQGRFSVKLNRTSQIEPLDFDVEIGSQAAEFSGALVDVQKGSGLIKRCPVCKRSLAKGVCTEHGKVDGTYDLRIKAVLDDGRRVQDVLINRETTERLVGLTLEEAREMAMEALDHEVVRGLIESKLVGRYFVITGPRVDRYLLVETISELPPVTESRVDELMSEVEAV